jgi:class 3 adenylate cyclase
VIQRTTICRTVTDDVRIDAGAAAYRGFLFSDMRGFTEFAERHGNAAAAQAVSRFLEIARNAIARHSGAEVKTEGDAIHAVFPSASSAVLCGLEIVDAAAELNEREPDRPLGLGVGVHAGEAVETAEGYIGRAVNIASRLCAAARPGEVLVSSTVKGITQASIPVGFIPRGRKRLKGIEDPVLVYAVTRDVNARAPRGLPRPAVIGATAGLGILALVAVVAIGASILAGAPGGPGTTPGPTAQPVVMGPLSIGSYASEEFQPGFTFDVADPGWTANRDLPGLFGLIREDAPRGSVYLARVQQVFEFPCAGGGEGATGPTAGDILAELAALDHVEVANVQPAEIDGAPGQQMDVTVADSALAACGGLVGQEVTLFGIGAETWGAAPGERFRVISVTVADQVVTVLLSSDWAQAQSVQELEDLLALGGRLLESVRFSGSPPG